MLSIEIGNTATVMLSGVARDDGTPEDGLSASFTIYDRAGTEVTGQGWPTPFLASGNGVYQATLDAAVQVQCGRIYRVHATGVAQDGATLDITEYAEAVHRGA